MRAHRGAGDPILKIIRSSAVAWQVVCLDCPEADEAADSSEPVWVDANDVYSVAQSTDDLLNFLRTHLPHEA